MTKRTTLLILDASMLAFFAFLMSWRLTGLVLHEWLGLVLIAMIAAHLAVHWGWIETRVDALVRRRRRFGALLLNAGLFVAMGTALISGVVISKVVFRDTLSPSAYLTWHGLHETASNFAMWLVAFHAAYNWDRITASLRHAFTRVRAVAQRPLRWSDIDPRLAARRLLWIAGISAALAAAVFADARLSGGERKVILQYPDGRRELVAPPPGIVERHRQYDWPELGQGAAWRFLATSTVMLVFGLIGRAAMVRVSRRRRHGHAGGPEPLAIE